MVGGSTSNDELESVRSYVLGGHDAINSQLISGKPLSSHASIEVANLDAAISQDAITSDMVLYRGMSFLDADMRIPKTKWTPARTIKAQANILKDSIGKTLDLPGFTSVTTAMDVAKVFARDKIEGGKFSKYILRLHVPKGTNALDVSGIGPTVAAGEKEMLLGRNGKIKIKSITMDAQGYNLVDADWMVT